MDALSPLLLFVEVMNAEPPKPDEVPSHAGMGTSTPTHGPSSPCTSPMYRAYALNRFRLQETMQGIPMSSVAPVGV
jgi:hypothetical protein